jgi:aminoglycoside 6-adenylyltransferase
MRSEAEIKKLIINVATNDNRVRGVLMNGSRANPNLTPDKYQDFDIVFIVNSFRDFTSDHSWVKVFGEIIIRQLPDEMILGTQKPDGFGYLMILEDGNRIDLTLYPVEKITNDYWPDSLTICLLDKDNQFESLPPPNDSAYFIKRPSAKEFSDVCNEFWWVSTYVAKGFLRNEITYAKEMLEIVVRPMFMKIIEWKIGANNRFSVSFGKAGRFMNKYVSDHYYQKVLQTYSDADAESNWKSLFYMLELFEQTSNEVAGKLNFQVDQKQQENTIRYLRQLYTEKTTANTK